MGTSPRSGDNPGAETHTEHHEPIIRVAHQHPRPFGSTALVILAWAHPHWAGHGMELGEAAAAYVAGAVIGALVFGHLTDRLGRKRMFLLTLALYIVATLATAVSLGPLTFFLCRFFTDTAIGGEYSAINSAIDELIPARVRGCWEQQSNPVPPPRSLRGIIRAPHS